MVKNKKNQKGVNNNRNNIKVEKEKHLGGRLVVFQRGHHVKSTCSSLVFGGLKHVQWMEVWHMRVL